MRETHSAGGVVLNTKGDVLVVNQNGNSWSLPKGHVEKGESSLDAAKREIGEESGVSHLELVKTLPSYKRFRIGLHGVDDKTEFKTIDMILFDTDEMELAPTDKGNPEAKWVRPEDVADLLTHPKDKEYFLGISHELGF